VRSAGLMILRLVVASPAVAQLAAPTSVRLEPYANAWLMRLIPDGPGGVTAPLLWEDRMDTISWAGRPAMQRVQIEHTRSPAGEGTKRYINVFDPTNLQPLMTEIRQGDGAYTRWEYGNSSVLQVQSVPAPGRRHAPGTVYDSIRRSFPIHDHFVDYFGGMYAMVVAAQPLKPGLQGSFNALITPDTIVTIPFRVLGQEDVRGAGGAMVHAYKVDIGTPGGPGGGLFTAWVIPKPPYILRLTTPQASPAGVWSWDEQP